MLESIVSLVALGIACLAYYRATRQQLPTGCFFALNEHPCDPDWRILIQNPAPSPNCLRRITIRDTSSEGVQNVSYKKTSVRGDLERSIKELKAANGAQATPA